jgi:hypothetical protein
MPGRCRCALPRAATIVAPSPAALRLPLLRLPATYPPEAGDARRVGAQAPRTPRSRSTGPGQVGKERDGEAEFLSVAVEVEEGAPARRWQRRRGFARESGAATHRASLS